MSTKTPLIACLPGHQATTPLGNPALPQITSSRSTSAFRLFLSLVLLIFLSACNRSEIRTIHAATLMPADSIPQQQEDCDAGRPREHSPLTAQHSIEDYGRYLVAYTEFDDQGWTTGATGENSQTSVLMARLEQELASSRRLLILVFVHGWHHNAYATDCNVRQFRTLVRLASDALTSPGAERKVIGVYVAWRGESVAAPIVNYTTFYGRKLAAERVAKGSARELFARLKLFETRHRLTAEDTTVRTIVVGHSFGGLIAFHSLAQSLLEDIVFTTPICQNQANPQQSPPTVTAADRKWYYPDLLVLINPAFEASRYEPLYRASTLPPQCHWPDRKRPRLITLAADNDTATGVAFPAARWVGTALDPYNSQYRAAERTANLNVVGFVDTYRTHRLCTSNNGTKVVLSPDGGDQSRLLDPNSPLLVARAAPDVLYGHSGFLYGENGKLALRLFTFLIEFYQHGDRSTTGECPKPH